MVNAFQKAQNLKCLSNISLSLIDDFKKMWWKTFDIIVYIWEEYDKFFIEISLLSLMVLRKIKETLLIFYCKFDSIKVKLFKIAQSIKCPSKISLLSSMILRKYEEKPSIL